MKNKLLVICTVLMLALGGLLPASSVDASSLKDMENKKKQIQQKRSGVNANIHSKETEINRLQAEQERLDAEIKRIDVAIGETNQKIREKSEQIEATKAEIEKLNEEIKVLQDRIAKRNELLKERARSFQLTGGSVSYLEVLLGAKSFSDFVDRVSAVSTIMDADQEILRQHQEDKQALEEKQKQVEEKLASLVNMKKELEEMKVQLSQQRAQKDKVMAQLAQKEKEAEADKLSLQEEADILKSQQAAIEQAIKLEKNRQAELAAARKRAEEEAKRRQNSSGGSSGGHSVSYPSISPGNFTTPTTGRISSTFGARWGKFHYGIDIANRGSNVAVLSAADGVVMKSYYSSSYGEAIFITHSIDGQLFTTVYAHLESRHVSTGSTVAKGQLIGYMGNTGRSYGQHLHFELHKGPWSASKSGAVNPMAYVPF
ncbi:murein hydrolase activator EnvC family protein [Peribacillus acanthi]|uniref:murein hydrolase activator EnvC family protein n=1 Tax=Peribacillus acanthi TaxID=2171554 RepID=UPI001F0C9C8E|nr:peptidoglycan DD-metalloendopeptidase family protein [Peribacillus acanthi]